MRTLDEAVERRGDLGRRSQCARPLVETKVGGQHEGAAAVPAGDELEEDASEVLLGCARAVAELVKDDQVRLAQLVEEVLKGVVGQRGPQLLEQGEGSEETDVVAGLAGRNAQADGEVGLPDARGADPDDRLALVDKGELGQVEHLAAIEGRLPPEIVRVDAADLWEVRLLDAKTGGGLVAGEHLGLGDTQQEAEGVELELRGLLEVLIEVLGEVSQVESLQQGFQPIHLVAGHRGPPSRLRGFQGAAVRVSGTRRGCAGSRRRP